MCISKRAIQVDCIGTLPILHRTILQDGTTDVAAALHFVGDVRAGDMQDLRRANSVLVEELLCTRNCAQASHQGLATAEAEKVG